MKLITNSEAEALNVIAHELEQIAEEIRSNGFTGRPRLGLSKESLLLSSLALQMDRLTMPTTKEGGK